MEIVECMLDQVRTMEDNLLKLKKGDVRVPVHRWVEGGGWVGEDRREYCHCNAFISDWNCRGSSSW